MQTRSQRRLRVSLLIAALTMVATSAGAQKWALKTNLPYWATLTPNLDAELRVSDKWSVEMSVGYNPWTLSNNRKLKHIAVEPEVRRWFCSTFSGHFLAANLVYSHYNAGGIDQPFFPELKDHRFQGDLGGIGVGYGYNLILSPRWSMEFELTLGVMITKYSKYECKTCGKKLEDVKKTFFSPTKIGVDIVYYL